jgi:hypothetical protein
MHPVPPPVKEKKCISSGNFLFGIKRLGGSGRGRRVDKTEGRRVVLGNRRSHSRPAPAQNIERIAVQDLIRLDWIALLNRFHQVWGLRVILTVFNGPNEAVKIGTDRNVVVRCGPFGPPAYRRWPRRQCRSSSGVTIKILSGANEFSYEPLFHVLRGFSASANRADTRQIASISLGARASRS